MRLGGLQKMTLLDFPGRVACTVFTLGCNFRCPFCHNSALVEPAGAIQESPEVTGERQIAVPADYPLEDFFKFLEKRKGLLDGVAITGGEPLLHKDIDGFIRRIRSLGYAVKLDTNGAFPDRLRALIDEGLVDYVAVDVKNSPEKYGLTAGVYGFLPQNCHSEPVTDVTGVGIRTPHAEGTDCHDQCARRSRNDTLKGVLPQVEETVALLKENRVDYEFRTTLVDEFHEVSDFEKIGRWIEGAPRYFIQQFVDSGSILGGKFNPASREKTQACLKAIQRYVPNAAIRGQD